TKRGNKNKKLGVNLNRSVSLYDRINQVDVLSADQFRQVINERANEDVAALLGDANTNWQDEIFKKALGYDTNVGLTGNITPNLPFRLSLGYTNQDGILKTSNFERTTAAVSLTPSLLDNHLTIDVNAKGSVEENQFADTGAIGSAIMMDPTQPVYSGNSDFGGYWEWLNNEGAPNANGTRNPLALLMLKDNHSYVNRLVGNVKFNYKIHGFEDLKAVLNLGLDYSQSSGSEGVPAYARMNYNSDIPENGGLRRDYDQIRRNQLFDFYLNYNKEVASIKSLFDVTAGYSYQSFDYDNSDLSTSENGEVLNGAYTDINTRVLIGFFGRFNYTFNDKYLLTGTVRYDGTSRFAEDVRWGLFPSLAAAWNISEEGFLKDSKTVSNLKLRAGWGITGQ